MRLERKAKGRKGVRWWAWRPVRVYPCQTKVWLEWVVYDEVPETEWSGFWRQYYLPEWYLEYQRAQSGLTPLEDK